MTSGIRRTIGPSKPPTGVVPPELDIRGVPRGTRLLKRFTFRDRRAGVAHVRWSEGAEPVAQGSRGLRHAVPGPPQPASVGQDPSELELTLHTFAIDHIRCERLDGPTRGKAARALLDATVRQRPSEESDGVVAWLKAQEQTLLVELARPSETEFANQVRHAMLPLLAVVVG